MKRENFYRRDPAKALSGMIGLSLEERGVYNTVLDLLYSTWRPLEDDRAFLANWCGCAVQKLNPIIRRLVDKGRLVSFEENGRTFLSDEAFEVERATVKGGAQTRSGRGQIAEKSGEVGEKSAGVEQNHPSCSENVKENQAVTALEKRREEKKETPIAPKGAVSKSRSSISPEAQAIWAAAPTIARQRSSLAETETELTAAIRRGHTAEQVTAGLAAAYASTVFAGEHAKGVHRLIAKDRWASFTVEPPRAAPAPWTGPPELRAWIVQVTDEGFAVKYLDPGRWDGGARAIIARNAYSADQLRTKCERVLRRANATVTHEPERAKQAA